MRRARAARAEPPTVTRLELAKILDCGPKTIEKWLEEGMPVRVRGRGGRASRYDPAECSAWLKARNAAAATAPAEGGELKPAQEKARREHWQALVAEQTFRIRERELLPRDEVLKVWTAEVAAVRTRLLSWATTIADRVHRAGTLDGLPGVERALHDAVREVLTELSGERENEAAAEPPKAKRRKRVA